MKKKYSLSYKEIFLLACIISLGICMWGMTFNFIVMTSNSGKMPVLADYNYSDDKHFTFQNKSEVNHWQKSDIIYLGNSIYSIGDLIMIFGGVSFTVFMVVYYVHKFYY